MVSDFLRKEGIFSVRYNILTFSFSSGPDSKVLENVLSMDNFNFGILAIGESRSQKNNLDTVISGEIDKFHSLLFVWRGEQTDETYENDINFDNYITNLKNQKLISIIKPAISHDQIPAELFKEILNLFFFSATATLAPAEMGDEEVSAPKVAGEETAATPTALLPGSQRVREIDEVWKTIGLFVRNSADIYDLTDSTWKTFDSVYPPVTTALAPSGPSSYDNIINAAANEFNIESALIKAIIYSESRFIPDLISTTGCVGLMQLCFTSANSEYITKKNSCCELENGESNAYPCKNERQRCGNKANWCVDGGYNCNPTNDDRFVPQKNIMSGAQTMKGKMNAIPVSWCGLECQVAAYNIGQCVIKEALEKEAGHEGEAIWDNVYTKITPEIMDNCSETYRKWDTIIKQTKIRNLDHYVQGIIRSYNQYKRVGTS